MRYGFLLSVGGYWFCPHSTLVFRIGWGLAWLAKRELLPSERARLRDGGRCIKMERSFQLSSPDAGFAVAWETSRPLRGWGTFPSKGVVKPGDEISLLASFFPCLGKVAGKLGFAFQPSKKYGPVNARAFSGSG